jgi:hypothetical protein
VLPSRNGSRQLVEIPTPPTAHDHDGNTLVPLRQFRSAAETELVFGLLRNSGIPAIYTGRYDPRSPTQTQQILVPIKRAEEANRLLANMREVESSLPPSEKLYRWSAGHW